MFCYYSETLGKPGAARSEQSALATDARLQLWGGRAEEGLLGSSAGRPGQGWPAEEEAVSVGHRALCCGQSK